MTQVVMPKISLSLVGSDVNSDQDATSRKVVSVGDRTLRTCGVNAVVISVAMLADISHFRLPAILTTLGTPSMEFHGAASRALRSTTASQTWLFDMCRTGAVEHVNKTMKLLSQESFNEFTLSCAPDGLVNVPLMSDGEIGYEDELAAYAGGFALQISRNRIKRMLYLTKSYPHLSVLLLGNDEDQAEFLRSFQADLNNFARLQGQGDHTSLMKVYMQRSPFQLLSVQQVAEACRALEFHADPSLLHMIRERTKTVMASQGVEDMNNHQKNSRQLNSWGGRYRRPQTSLATTVRSGMLSTVHHYNVLTEPTVPTSVKPLQKEDMCASGDASMDLNSIASFRPQAPYFSPAAEHVGIGAADMEVLRHIGDPTKFKNIRDAWKGFFCDSSHLVAFRYRDAAGQPLTADWFVALYHFKDSACLVWPVRVEDALGGTDFQAITFTPLEKPKLMAVISFENLECFTFEWKSWAWQVKMIPQCTDILRPAVRAFKLSPSDTVFKVAARNAWWSLQRATLELVAQHLGEHVGDSTNMFDLLFTLTKKVLGCSDSEVLAILESKMHKMMRDTAAFSHILYIDEATACLREDDRQEIQREQQKVATQKAEVDDIKEKFQAKETKVRAATGGPTAKAHLKSFYKGPKKWPENKHTPQVEAKKMLPPDSYLWRSRTDNSWNARYKAMPARSARDNTWGGEQGALRQVLQHVWECYLDIKKLSKRDCPLQGLW